MQEISWFIFNKFNVYVLILVMLTDSRGFQNHHLDLFLRPIVIRTDNRRDVTFFTRSVVYVNHRDRCGVCGALESLSRHAHLSLWRKHVSIFGSNSDVHSCAKNFCTITASQFFSKHNKTFQFNRPNYFAVSSGCMLYFTLLLILRKILFNYS